MDRTSSPFPVSKSVSVFLLLVLLFGLFQVEVAVRQVSADDLPLSVDDLRTGKLAEAFEKQLVKHLPAREFMISAANGVRYLLTGAVGEQVRVGRDGWLFLADELRFYPNADEALAMRLNIVKETQTRLTAQGVTLLVVLIPDKARVLETSLGGAYPSTYRTRYEQAVSQLQTAGVHVIDVQKKWAGDANPVFYKTDTHWNQYGAKQVATAIAQTVRALHPELAMQPGFELKIAEKAVERPGDLLSMLGLPSFLRPAADWEHPVSLSKPLLPATSLFDDQAVQVVLSGTSYSLRAGFSEQLSFALGLDVLTVAKDGGGFMRSTHEYLSNDAFKENMPTVLIWEIPERVLSEPFRAETKWFDRLD